MKKLYILIFFIVLLNFKINYAHYFFDNNSNWTGDYHEYNDNIEVITAVEVFAPEGFPRQNRRPHERKDDEAKAGAVNKTGECKVNFSGACGSKTQQGAIAKGESRLFWVKWKTPKINTLFTERTVTINVSVPSGAFIIMNGEQKTSATITCKIYNPKYETPPDTNYDDFREESDIETSAPVDRMENVLKCEFHTYTYKWEEDWHYVCTRSGNDEHGYPEEYSENYMEEKEDVTCMMHECPENSENHECPTGDCTVQAQDWGEVIWERSDFSVSLATTAKKIQLADNTPFPDGYPQDFDYDRTETIRSGYGIYFPYHCQSWFEFPPDPTVIIYDYRDYYTYPQVTMYFYPEFDYDTYADRGDNIKNDSATAGLPQMSTMESHTPKNPYSHFNNRVHYIPVYFPDGAYEVLVEVSSCFSPAGELRLSDSEYMEIEGSVWDDLHIKQGN